jgi:hypothetical protein
VSSSASQTAAWLRDNINEGQYLYAFYGAVFLREDLNDIILPAPYETYPYYFVKSDIIQKAYETRMRGE